MPWAEIYPMLMELMLLQPVIEHTGRKMCDEQYRRQISKFLIGHQLDEIFKETDELKHAALLIPYISHLMKSDYANLVKHPASF